jgi:hypothetical protein
MIDVVGRCFKEELGASSEWQENLKNGFLPWSSIK